MVLTNILLGFRATVTAKNGNEEYYSAKHRPTNWKGGFDSKGISPHLNENT
nr:unnamed protein product [Callosobruchus analis]